VEGNGLSLESGEEGQKQAARKRKMRAALRCKGWENVSLATGTYKRKPEKKRDTKVVRMQSSNS